MSRGMQLAALISIALTLAIHAFPGGHLVGRPLVWLSTLAHELGHGLAAVLVGGSFQKLLLYADASGVAYTATPGSGWRDGAVAAGGLLGPPVVAAGCFRAARTTHTARVALGAVSVMLGVVALVWVRNLFGFVFVLALALALGAVARWLGPQAARFVVVFLGLQLALSVFSRADYLFTPVGRVAGGLMPSDVAQMEAALVLPYWFWGAACALFSVLVLVLGLRSAMSARDDGADAAWPRRARAARFD